MRRLLQLSIALALLALALGGVATTARSPRMRHARGSRGATARPVHTSIRALDTYFRLVLDRNQDGIMDRKELTSHLQDMEGDSDDLTSSILAAQFELLDLNADDSVTPQELCLSLGVCRPRHVRPRRWARILRAGEAEPTQIHLAATTTPERMLVSWAQNVSAEAYPAAFVQWGYEAGGPYPFNSQAFVQRYNLTQHGMTYTSLPLFTANMGGLVAATAVYYRVGVSFEGVERWSAEQRFTTLPDPALPPGKQLPTRMVTYGDQGTVIPMGAKVCKWVAEEHSRNPFTAMLHVGDLSYAGVNSWGEYSPTWDVWMEQISPIARSMPYMVVQGNHDDFNDAVSYRHLFHMPGDESRGNASFWWSFAHGAVHVTAFSTEYDYAPGSAQYQWMEEDFRKARDNPNTPWLVLSGHRPMYGSDKQQFESHIPGCPILQKLEPLINKYKVDIVLTGHCHSYERSWPVNNGTAFKDTLPSACPDDLEHNTPPQQRDELAEATRQFWADVEPRLPLPVFDRDAAQTGPVYVVQGTAGVLQIHGFVDPQPDWSASRVFGTYGYGVLSVATNHDGCSTLLYQFRTEGGEVVDQMAMVKQIRMQARGVERDHRNQGGIALE